MVPLNRVDTLGRINVIEHGWKFYKARPWGLGLFYWTGFDYRGEPNPMKWPATGSQFGILDYCGFPKDEAFYLKAAWKSEPLVHICGPYNGEVWVYSNCDKVRLFAGNKSLGTKTMPENGHLVWNVAGLENASFNAVGYRDGKRVTEDKYPLTYSETTVVPSKSTLLPDGQDVIVIDIYTSEPELIVSVKNACLLGWGNGDPGFKEVERPQPVSDSQSEQNSQGLRADSMTIKPFSGCAQILVRSVKDASGEAAVTIGDRSLAFSYCL